MLFFFICFLFCFYFFCVCRIVFIPNISFFSFTASVGGNRDVALALLMAGADINAQDRDGKTALMIGIINGHQPLVELLLKRNANLKVKNEVNLIFIVLCNF